MYVILNAGDGDDSRSLTQRDCRHWKRAGRGILFSIATDGTRMATSIR